MLHPLRRLHLRAVERFPTRRDAELLEQHLGGPIRTLHAFEHLGTWSDEVDFSDFLDSYPDWVEAICQRSTYLLDDHHAGRYLWMVGLCFATLAFDALEPTTLEEFEAQGLGADGLPTQGELDLCGCFNVLSRIYADVEARHTVSAVLRDTEALLQCAAILLKRAPAVHERVKGAVDRGRDEELGGTHWSVFDEDWCERVGISTFPLPLTASGLFGFPLVVGLLTGGLRVGA